MDLQLKRQKALELYKVAQANLKVAAELSDPDFLSKTAQIAQDAWNEFKKLDTEVTNGLVLKTLRDSYHI